MRKTKTITLPGKLDPNGPPGQRDNGKTFLITEMSARQAEQWADRAFLALAHSRVNLPSEAERSGMAGIVGIVTLFSSVQFPELVPLMDELLRCVEYVYAPASGTHGQLTRPLVDNGTEGDDIEEVATRQMLRREVMDLHVNFLLAARMLDLIARASELKEVPEDTWTIQTSQSASESSSEAA